MADLLIPIAQRSSSPGAVRGAGARRAPYLLTLIALWAVVWLPRLSTPAIFDDSDAMYAEVPREMLLRGDWITPCANFIRYLEKPPLYYWLVATSYRLFGVSVSSARLVSVLLSLGIVLTCYFLGELLFDALAGWIAGATMATSVGYYLFNQQLMPDPLFTLLLSLAFYAFLRGDREARRSKAEPWQLLSFGFLALAVLARGLVGLVFPALTIGAFALCRWRHGRPVRIPLGRGLLLFTAIVLQWHLLVGLRNPGWAWFYFVNEQILRFLNRREPRDYGTMPLAAFWLLHLVWFFPWSFLLPLAGQGLRQGVRARDDRWLFPGIWAGSVLFFFSFSTRLEYYSMPAFPALALMIGAAGASACRPPASQKSLGALLRALTGLTAVTSLMVVAAFGLAVASARSPAGPARPLTDPDSPYSVFMFSPVFHLTLEQLRGLVAPAMGVALFAFAGSALALTAARRGRILWTARAIALGMVPCLGCLHLCIAAFEADLSSRALADDIWNLWLPGDRIIVDGLYETYNSLGFYTSQPLFVLDARRGYLEYGSRYPDAPSLFLDERAFERVLHEKQRRQVFLVTRAPQRFLTGRERPRLLGSWGGKSLLLFRCGSAQRHDLHAVTSRNEAGTRRLPLPRLTASVGGSKIARSDGFRG